VKDSEFIMDCDLVIIAIGQTPNPLIQQTTKGLKTTKWGTIIVDDDGKTSIEGVYAGGDIVTGAATVISAMGAGKKAALKIHEFIQESGKSIHD
jgi:glutamate synthase (NADPH/NADH) small chain